MNDEKTTPTRFLTTALAVPILASIVIACATSLTQPATPTPPDATSVRSQATETTPAPTSTAEPASTERPVAPTDTPAPATPSPMSAPTDTEPPPPTATEASAPTDTPAPSPTPAPTEEGLVADAQHGQELFNSLGCAGCHGAQGEGGIGPTIAGTELSLSRVIRQYRVPYQSMPRFGPDQVSESDVSDIYAYLQTLPTPATRVPSILANVTPEAGIGTVQGTIRYSETGEPAADEQIYILPASQNPDGSLEFSFLPHLPADTTDAQGRFEIADVEAQLYAVFYTRQEMPVRDEEGNIVLVNVLPGETAQVEGFMPAP